MSERNLHRTACYAVEEAPVVRHHDQSPRIGLQILFKPFDRLYIEMVGGLVEQHQVGSG